VDYKTFLGVVVVIMTAIQVVTQTLIGIFTMSVKNNKIMWS
jgi:hypothetical protein